MQPAQDLGADDEHSERAQDVGDDQDPLPPPPVEQYAGERADERVGDEQRGEPGRDVGRVRLALGVEQHRAGQAGLEDAVAELAEQASRVQATESLLGEGGEQVSLARHVDDASGGRRAFRRRGARAMSGRGG